MRLGDKTIPKHYNIFVATVDSLAQLKLIIIDLPMRVCAKKHWSKLNTHVMGYVEL